MNMRRLNSSDFSWMRVEISSIPPPFMAMGIANEYSEG
jgi:hypothetical protein